MAGEGSSSPYGFSLFRSCHSESLFSISYSSLFFVSSSLTPTTCMSSFTASIISIGWWAKAIQAQWCRSSTVTLMWRREQTKVLGLYMGKKKSKKQIRASLACQLLFHTKQRLLVGVHGWFTFEIPTRRSGEGPWRRFPAGQRWPVLRAGPSISVRNSTSVI